ncbi:Alpha-tocopherol transfer protein [Trachymyrmex septentrionalis]|uniref:Alpha-tocopherol transfer protein n=1 Tax=Trachymyrmex septentrionalis TaxID=34720 RepID=A0A195FH04_9HYME|nr:PREDICTED: alpha-tocopherol transfer protein-like [Trachymyrmex septentrionalis]KYN39651.1 Alpha-tocopherol transfer protein [Trachymyrmex septentrionalis]
MKNEHKYNSVEYDIQHELTSTDKEYAATHLNETDETRETTIAEIRRWINDEMHIQIDDFLILRFLRVCKFNLEKTKTRIQNYYKLRSDLPEWFTNTDPFQPELQELINMGLYLPLRKPDNQGRLVLIVRTTLHNPRIHKESDIFKIGVMMVELAMKNRAIATSASVYGLSFINDAINPTIHQIFQLGRPSVLKKIAHTWQNCYPMRFQLINVINAPMFLDIPIKIFKSFLSEKINKRLHVYSHMMQSCFKDIPVDILPVEYGGTGGTIQELIEYWKTLIEENREWFISNKNN